MRGSIMLKKRIDHTHQRERALALGLTEVASELRLVDAVDYIAFIRTEQFGNLSALVNSSTELYFKPGTVCFGLSGDIELKWGGVPSVMLDMEFHHEKVNVYFRLMLEALRAGVEINYISFDGGSSDPEENTTRLIGALENARIMPVKGTIPSPHVWM
jgi:hypothetical protein